MSTVQGAVNRFAMKEPKHEESKEPKPAQITTRLRICDPDPAELAELCAVPTDAKKVLIAASKANAKVDIPCRGGTMVVEVTKSGRRSVALSTDRVTLCRVSLDARKDDSEVAHLTYTEPFEEKTALFYAKHLGVDLSVEVNPTQSEIGD